MSQNFYLGPSYHSCQKKTPFLFIFILQINSLDMFQEGQIRT